MKEMEEISKVSDVLIESLKNKLETYDRAKKSKK